MLGKRLKLWKKADNLKKIATYIALVAGHPQNTEA